MHVFGRPKFDLPPAPTNISGREGRSRMLFRVPPAWQKVLYGKSIPSAGPTGAIEWLYEKEHGKCFHAVIEGQHPGGNGWFYRWEEGKSPHDIPVPDLPEWMISAIITWPYRKAAENGGGVTTELVEDKPGPVDVLTPGQTKKLLKGMQQFFPYRGAPAGKFGGHYDVLRRLTAVVVARHWRSEAVRDVAAGLGRQVRLVRPERGQHGLASLSRWPRATPAMTRVAPWKAAWSLATENGWKAFRAGRCPAGS